MSLLKLTDVSYRYTRASKDVLQEINIEFECGKVYAIVGKSGNGKTTLLSIIAGLDKVTGGEITYKGENILAIDLDKFRAKNIGVIFQSNNLLLNATALENIELSMNISGCKQKSKKLVALDLLEKVGIDKETANRKILKLSGGEQQRVGIARALAHNPDIIIADEPTGNLDSETQAQIIGILKDLAVHENICVIVATHSDKVSSYADEIWGINQGKLIFVKQTLVC